MSSRETAANSPTIAQIERRTFVRLASDLQATCRPAGALRDFGWPGTVCDISRGGIGLALTHRFQPGTELAVELRDEKGELRRILRRGWCTPRPPWSVATPAGGSAARSTRRYPRRSSRR